VNRARVHAACGREGALGCCAREYPLGDEGFGADKETGKGAAAFVNNAGYIVACAIFRHRAIARAAWQRSQLPEGRQSFYKVPAMSYLGRHICLILVLVLLFVPAIADASARGIQIKDKSGKTVSGYAGSYALLIGASDYTNGWPDLESIPSELKKVEQALKAHAWRQGSAWHYPQREA